MPHRRWLEPLIVGLGILKTPGELVVTTRVDDELVMEAQPRDEAKEQELAIAEAES